MPITVLGEGTFGVVIKIKDTCFGESAVKIIPTWDKKNNHLTEVEIAQKFSHRNVLQCYDCRRDNDLQRYPVEIQKLLQQKWMKRNVVKKPLSYFHIRMELCNAGSLQDWIVATDNQSRNLETTDGLYSQMLDAVAVLHKEKIVHGDLKPQNFFLHKISHSDIIVKLGDFGDSFDQKNGPHRQTFGTLEYKEESNGSDERITTKYDIYALGLIYSILFMGSFLNFHKNFVYNNQTRRNALHNLLKSIKNSGSSKLIKETHPEREKFIRQLIADEERPDVYLAIQNFSRIVKETNFSLMLSSVPGRNPLFQGRQQILQEIQESSSVYVLLYGQTGTGKKTIAAEYFHSKSESRKFKEVLWFDCSSKGILKREYRNLQKERKELKGPLGTVLNWLNSQPGLAVVYVNVKNVSKMLHLMATDRKNGLVIRTSRINSDDWPEYFNKIKVGLLPEIDCSNLIYEAVTVTVIKNQNDSPTKEVEEACRFLSNHLGYSTTAITQSFVYLRKKNGHTTEIDINLISKYVENCQQMKHEVKRMQHDIIMLRKFEIGSIYKTIVSTMRDLSGVSSIALKWLKICAYLDYQHIPEFMFDNFLKRNDAIQLKNETLKYLNYYSLIEYHGIYRASFGVSRIVQRVVQMYFGSSFEETIENISNALSIPHLNDKGTTRVHFDCPYKDRTLQLHYETILIHLSDYKSQLPSRSQYLLTCCPTSSKKMQHVEQTKFRFEKVLGLCYKSQSLREEEMKCFNQRLSLKEIFCWNDSFIRGTSLLTKAKHMLRCVTVKRFSANEIDCVMEVFHEAEKLLKECYNRNENRIEIYRCYWYLALCCDLASNTGMNDFDEKKNRESRGYLNEALKIILKAVDQKKNVLIALCGTLKRIGENYSYSQEWEMMEKYLLLAFQCHLLKNLDNVDDKLTINKQLPSD